jgi:hypothetical protein
MRLQPQALDLLQADRQRLDVAVDVGEERDHAGGEGYGGQRRRGRAEPVTSSARSPCPEPRPPRPLWVVSGPTASRQDGPGGRARRAQLGLEILSMDSMAVYRSMDIGTAKPDAAERAVRAAPPDRPGRPARDVRHGALVRNRRTHAGRPARARPRRVVRRWHAAVPDGVLQGHDAGPRSATTQLRERLEAREAATPGCLHEELARAIPSAAARIHRQRSRRLVRALEVLELTGKPISEQQDHFDRAGWAAAVPHRRRAPATRRPARARQAAHRSDARRGPARRDRGDRTRAAASR